MEQSEAAAAAPVVRQLDFSVSYNASTKANALAKGILILPEHPQAQLQSKLLALAQSQHLHARESSSSPPQTKRPPRKVVAVGRTQIAAPRTSSDGGLLKSKPIAPRLAHPVKPVYCECFAAGSYCDNCNCINCHNKKEHEADRKGSIDAILERNPNAFTPKIANSPHGATDGGSTRKDAIARNPGASRGTVSASRPNILCSDKCKCMDCKNFEGSEEKKALSQGHPEHQSTSIQQAANAAINGAIGTPPSNEEYKSPIRFQGNI
ncbi:UNVERIFIED_CONTAM: protein tesmin/TSO1-like CXC 7 [Sesamum angustifolium]|uniref:Protein tesmin/TSO1-like CXC 7 n=1 Tax=Sesamum angustifolium TaxID=2727405 RepID=A0AAW2ILR7_9LAMI